MVPGEDVNSLLNCHKIWSVHFANILTNNQLTPYRDKLSSRPDFKDGTIDIDNLCSELRAKARCSESGVVVDHKDVEAALQRLPKDNKLAGWLFSLPNFFCMDRWLRRTCLIPVRVKPLNFWIIFVFPFFLFSLLCGLDHSLVEHTLLGLKQSFCIFCVTNLMIQAGMFTFIGRWLDTTDEASGANGWNDISGNVSDILLSRKKNTVVWTLGEFGHYSHIDQGNANCILDFLCSSWEWSMIELFCLFYRQRISGLLLNLACTCLIRRGSTVFLRASTHVMEISLRMLYLVCWSETIPLVICHELLTIFYVNPMHSLT